MRKLAYFVHDRAKFIIAFVIIVNIVSLISFVRFNLDTDFLAFFSEGNPEAELYTELNDKYQSGEIISVLIEEDSSLLEQENLLDVFRLQQEIAEIKGVAQVQGFIPPQVMVGPGMVAIDESVITGQYDLITNFIRNRYIFREQFLTEDEQNAILMVSLGVDAPTDEIITSLREIQEESAFDISLSGNEVIKDTIAGYLKRILFIIPPVSILLIVLIFYLAIKVRRLTVMAIIPAGMGALWTFGTLFWSGQQLNLISVISPIFIIVIGSAYGLHYVSHYLDNIQKYPDKRELTAETMSMVGTPIFLATITTMAGFISLVWTDVVPMRQMGAFVTMGIGYAGFLALFFVPAVLSRIKTTYPAREPHESKLNKLVVRASGHRVLVPVIFGVLVLGTAAFIPRLQVISDQLMFFKESSEIRQAFSRVEEHFGGAMPLTGEIIAPNGPLSLMDYDFATSVLETERQLEELPGVNSVFSIFDLIVGFNSMVTGEEGFPSNPAALNTIRSQVSPDEMSAWASPDGFRLMVRTDTLTPEEIETIQSFVAESDNIRVITGMPLLFLEMNTLVVRSQVQSLGLALVLIFIMLWVTLKRITAALAGLLPIVITISAILGMLVMTGFHLNIMTATLSAMAIGVGVDYSIHIISGIYYYREQGMKGQAAVTSALNTVARPVLANAFGLAIGYSAMFFSPLQIHTQAASVMWVAMVVSSLAALVLVPIFYRR